MIPLLLEIKNFLSYGDAIQRIDFEPYQLICLSGKNGNGKSALLDAITWALWGQARKVTGAAKADDGLVRLGQTRMMVSLTFIFNGLHYRVRREYAKTYGKPYAALDFELYDEQKASYVSLTDKTIRATQAKIQSLVGLDFDTFVNSAFIRQGQSNEFSKKSAKERKHILSTILGLGKYDALQQAALDKARGQEQEKKMLQLQCQQALGTIAQEEPLLVELANKKQALGALSQAAASAAEQQAVLVQKQTAYGLQIAQFDAMQTMLGQTREQAAQQRAVLSSTIKEWRSIHAKSLTLPCPLELEKQKKALSAAEEMLMKQHAQFMLIQQQLLALQQQKLIVQQEVRASAEKQLIEHKAAIQNLALEKRHYEVLRTEKNKQIIAQQAVIVTLTNDTKKIALELPQFAKDEAAFCATKNQFDKRRGYYQTLVQRGNWTKQQLTDLQRRQLVVDDNANPSCPLCQQLLTVKRKQFLASSFDNEKRQVTHRLERITALLAKLKEILVAQHAVVTSMTTQHELQVRKQLHYHEAVKQIVTEQHDLDVLELEVAKITQEETALAGKLTLAQTMLEAIEKSIEHTVASDERIVTLTSSIAALEKQLAAINWQQEAYTQLQQQRSALEAVITVFEQHQREQEHQRERRSSITRLIKQLKELALQQNELTKKLACQPQIMLELATLQATLQELTAKQSEYNKEKELLLHGLGKLEHELHAIALLKISIAETTKQIAQCDKQIQQFSQLAVAFSKNGIQALLIEEAIPEIEHEANQLLSRLTDNQAHIFIESLKDLKNGGVKETLDIHIADTAGIRPYELFSGGEAFRVDFALRIAIAKLLARRAGTALQTLIIDEGFGSQDEEGLAHIMEALYAIQQDFAKIIIVSHLPEFKQNFPVHFIVEKGPTGSVVRVEERG